MLAIISERYGRGIVRALVLSNMQPDPAHPERGSFVRDQVAALRELAGLEVELFEFPPGARSLAHAAIELRRRYGPPSTLSRRTARPKLDVVHSHFGLTAWPALAVNVSIRALTVHGTDLSHPRTRLATAAILPTINLLAAVSRPLISELPTRSARQRALVLPCGVDLERFRPIPRAEARAMLGLDVERPYVLFPADPARPEKRHDRAVALAQTCGVDLHVLRGVDPTLVPLWINGANAVLVPSEREGFGLAVLEALACDVPVIATPVGIHSEALSGVAGTLCAQFELPAWRDALTPHLHTAEARISGRTVAARFSAHATAERVYAAWQQTLEQSES